MQEPIGTIGILCPQEAPLLGFVSTVMPAIAVGNTVVAIPSELYPLITADLYQLFESSDLPAGTVNIVTGRAARTPQNSRRTRRRRRPLVPRRRPHLRHRKSSFHRKSQTSLHQRSPPNRLVQLATIRRPLLPTTRHPNQKHLGPLRRINRNAQFVE